MPHMNAGMTMKSTIPEKLTLGVVLTVAAVVRLWDCPSYLPQFWDEAKYICEVEELIPYFSVNAGAFAFLKLGYYVFGLPSYAPIVCGIFGVLTVGGCYFVGMQVFPGQRRGVHLGLLMAGLAALMPYLVRYSHHAFPTVFSLCFMVWAMVAYLARLGAASTTAVGAGQRHWRLMLTSAALLAMVPGCSFKFLLPTVIAFLLLEVYLWRIERRRGTTSLSHLFFATGAGLVLFFLLPLLSAWVSGYDGWFGRACLLAAEHSSLGTMRLSGHFIYPLHVYYLCGLAFGACALAGIWIIMYEPKNHTAPLVPTPVVTVLSLPCGVYVLFFGFLSHLQAARMYALTIPILIFYAAAFLLWLSGCHRRRGLCAMWGVLLLVWLSQGMICFDQLNRTSGLRDACRKISQHIKQDQTVYAGAMGQLFYGINRSPDFRITAFSVESPWRIGHIQHESHNPPMVVLQDGVDLSFIVANRDKYDRLQYPDSVCVDLAQFRSFPANAELMYATAESFSTSMYYHLENVYSWQSYHILRELLPAARDSIFIYQLQPPAQVKSVGE